MLISPGGAPAYAWHNQLTALAAAGHSVYVVDLPGQGRTMLHDAGFGWDLPAMTSALASFLDAVGLRRTALVGNSWSGGWALAFAQRYPQRVIRLVLVDSSGLNVPRPAGRIPRRRPSREAVPVQCLHGAARSRRGARPRPPGGSAWL